MSKTVQVLFKNDEKSAPPQSSEIDCRILENGVTEALLQVNLKVRNFFKFKRLFYPHAVGIYNFK